MRDHDSVKRPSRADKHQNRKHCEISSWEWNLCFVERITRHADGPSDMEPVFGRRVYSAMHPPRPEWLKKCVVYSDCIITAHVTVCNPLPRACDSIPRRP